MAHLKRKYFFYCSLWLILLVGCKQNSNQDHKVESSLTTLQGSVFGTSYRIIYGSKKDFQVEIDDLFYNINKSLSTYQNNSDISKINKGEEVLVDDYFVDVFKTSRAIYNKTNGAFDPTIGAVVNAWDFGPEGRIVDLDSLKIDSLMVDVGFEKVRLNNGRITKPKNTFLDFNAIAKGYAVDVVAEFLSAQEISNFLVEIGGEIRVKGKNIDKNTFWTVGIEEPHFDGQQSVLKVIELKDEGMATSGVYRKFKVDEHGNRYSHIIDTATGYPSKTNILGVSVIAKSCMEADAYATAFKSMGIDKIKTFLNSHKDLKAFVIFENEDGEIETLNLNGFP